MSKPFDQVPFIHLVPPSLSGDIKVQGAAQGADSEIQRAQADLPVVRILSRIDELPEPVVDLLGWQFHVDFWDSSLPLARKRDLVKTSIKVHKTKGTPAAVEMVLAAIGYPATVTEWSEYAGDPYRFRVEADLTGAILSDELHARLLRLIQEYKNTRSWLDRLDMVATSTGLARVGLAGMAGEIGTVYPWTPDEVEQTSPTYAAMALGPSAEIGEVYPLE